MFWNSSLTIVNALWVDVRRPYAAYCTLKYVWWFSRKVRYVLSLAMHHALHNVLEPIT